MSVKIASDHPDDLFISRITNAIVVCDMVMSTLTLPLQFIILYVLIKDKEYSGSFFKIYKVGLIYDIAGFVCVNVIGVIPTRGLILSEEFAASQFYLKLADSLGTRAFWLETFIELFAFSLLMWILYGIMIWKFRAKISKYRTRSEKADSRRAFSLLIIAVNVLLLETIYCIFYGYWFVTNVNYQVDFRGFMAAFYSLIDVYSCSPSFLLLFFCKSVRERLFAMFR
ncbi:hypothetical protein PRIPAC_82726 [Pristionchus pacificus]|uniref:G protein-coupled receptor n=1 Tax=Pristionchus pacificus TaxID=54126 RepID=A0A2A6CM12_PRIPA|nr:hypothetical protein PRIPAC_82726 [Pristionchus pacificus]|eukprot:PDM79117.1 G protein-coupled receptor [Pristionchus pacificus]